ncbi:MAG: hypothetical protein JWN30_1801 [Bacilli bacterium]|nr:hypothetical protein [Bacilli bacterium]
MNLPWIILFVLVILFVQEQIYKRWGLSRISYSRYFNVVTAFPGDEIQMIEQIGNHKLLPVPWVRLESRLHPSLSFQNQANQLNENEQLHRSLFSLTPYLQITRRHKVICTKRGCYDLKSAAITCGDLFGLEQTYQSVNFSNRLLVYPALIPLSEIPLPSHSLQGNLLVKRWILPDPFLVSGVRAYTDGDPLNSINWKATARAGSLQVQQHDFTADQELMIGLNFVTASEVWDSVTQPDLVETGISYAASLAQYVIAQGLNVGFICNGGLIDQPDEPVRLEHLNSHDQLNLMLETMAKLILKPSLAFYRLLKEENDAQRTRTDYLLLTAVVDERTQEQIDLLRRTGNSVEIVWLKQLAGSMDEAV